MERIINTACLFAWTFVLFNTGFKLFLNPEEYFKSDLTSDVNILRWVQTTQVLDFLLILIGKSKGSLVASFCQIFARLFVVWYFIEFESDHKFFAIVTIIWSIAEVNRYFYYLFNQSKIAILLRYNLFIVLYPVGVYGQVNLVENFMKRHAQIMTDNYFYFCRFSQFCIVTGMIVIYIYLLMSRSRNMKKIFGNQNKQEGVVQDRQRSKSPKGKRQ